MSIQSEIDRIISVKNDLRTALKAKGAALTDGSVLADFVDAVNGLQIGGGSIELPTVSVTPGVLLSGETAIDSDGNVVEGAIAPVSLESDGNYVSIGEGYTTGGSVTIPDAVITAKSLTVESGSTSSSSATLRVVAAVSEDQEGFVDGEWELNHSETIVAAPAKEWTPGTSNQTLAKHCWLNGDQVIKGDSNLTAENIKSGVTIFDVTGSFEGSSTGDSANISFGVVDENGKFQPLDGTDTPPTAVGDPITGEFYTFDTDRDAPSSSGGGGGSLAKVTEFRAPHDAFSAISAIEVSGLGVTETGDGDTDFSDWNGTYEVTPATFSESDINKRVFKHTSQEKYLYRIYDDEYGDVWVFDTDTGAQYVSSATFYSSNLQSGTWSHYDYEISVSLTINQVSTNYPAQPLVLEAVSASYADGVWSFGSAVSLTEYNKEPAVDGIYFYKDTKIVGDVVCFYYEEWMPTEGLLCYFPMTDKGDTVYDRVNNIPVIKVGTIVQDGVKQDNSSGAGALVGVQTAFTLPKNFTISAKLNYSGLVTSSNNGVVDFGQYHTGGFGIRANTKSTSVSYGLRLDSSDGQKPITNVPRDEEHTITFTLREDAADSKRYCDAYLDGEFVASTNYDYYYEVKDAHSINFFTRWEEGQTLWASFPGTIRDVLLYNRILTPEEISSIANHN